MKNSYETYHLLADDDECEENPELLSSQPRSSRLYSMNGIISILVIVISVSSLVINIFFACYIIQLRGQLETAGATQFGLSTVLYYTMS